MAGSHSCMLNRLWSLNFHVVIGIFMILASTSASILNKFFILALAQFNELLTFANKLMGLG